MLTSIIFYFVGIPILNKINENKNKTLIEEFLKNGCTYYSDGCNGCRVDTNGNRFCTLRGCNEIEKAKCYEYNLPSRPL